MGKNLRETIILLKDIKNNAEFYGINKEHEFALEYAVIMLESFENK